MRRTILGAAAALAVVGACAVDVDDRVPGADGSVGAPTSDTTAGTSDGGTQHEGAPGPTDDGSEAVDDSESDDDHGLILDVAGDGGETIGLPAGCNAVDILFVIDSSASMHDEQVALAEAFPQFTATIVETLPTATSLHIGVTTMEMSPEGSDSIQYPCDSPNTMYYQTPDVDPSGVNGAQGRLFHVPDGPAYFEISTDASAAELAELDAWFVQAAAVGIEGSSEEMPLGAAGWAFDPANAPTNDGFVRDQGAALVLFFVTDESDQTPIDGVAQGLVDRIAAAKSGCGGLDCVAAGGTVRESCLPEDAMGTFFAALDPARVHTAPLEYDSETTAEPFVDALRDNLTPIIVDLCESIPEG